MQKPTGALLTGGRRTMAGFEWQPSPNRAGRERQAPGVSTSALVTPVPKKQPRTDCTISSARLSAFSAVLPLIGYCAELGAGSGAAVKTSTSRSAAVKLVSKSGGSEPGVGLLET